MKNFNINRCCNYALKEFYENKKTILISSGIVTAILFLNAVSLFSVKSYALHDEKPQLILIYLLGIYYTSFIIRKRHKSSLIEELAVPASASEKYISKIALYMIVLPFAIAFIYLLLYTVFFEVVNSGDISLPVLVSFKQITAFVFSMSIFIMGNVFHPRHSIIYTLLLGWLFVLILYSFEAVIGNIYGIGMNFKFDFYGGTLWEKVLKWIFSLAFLTVGYVRYTEIDIKKIK